MKFSVITPTYNRRTIVPRAINSAFEFVQAVGDSEVVVIDDASQDDTATMINNDYAEQLASGALKFIERKKNGGSTVAKSEGARQASGDWLVFLDSDDQLLPEAAKSVPTFIDAHRNTPVFLFRCIDQNGNLVGPPAPSRSLSFSDLLTGGTPGECIPVISRTAFCEFPSEHDILAFEFMSVLRIVRAHGPAMLSDAVARRYYMDGEDRLTSRAGNLRRARQHAEGFQRMLSEFGAMMPLRQRMGLRSRIICYRVAAALGAGQMPKRQS